MVAELALSRRTIGVELSSLAPDIPQGLEELGHYRNYSVETAPDGSACTFRWEQNVDGTKGSRVVGTTTFSAAEVLASRAWIDKAYQAIYSTGRLSDQMRELDLVDEITKLAAGDIETAQTSSASSSPKPSL